MTSHAWHPRLAQSLDRLTGFRFASTDEIPACWRLVKKTVDASIAPLPVVSAIHKIHRNAVAIFDETYSKNELDIASAKLQGVAFFLFLNAKGVHAIRTSNFSSTIIDPTWLCSPNDSPHASYVWSIASEERANGHRLSRFCHYLSTRVFSDIDQYARITTTAGQRLGHLLGFEPLEGSRPDYTGTFYIRKRTSRRIKRFELSKILPRHKPKREPCRQASHSTLILTDMDEMSQQK